MVKALAKLRVELPMLFMSAGNAVELQKQLPQVAGAARFLNEQIEFYLVTPDRVSAATRLRAKAVLKQLWAELDGLDVVMKTCADQLLDQFHKLNLDRTQPREAFDNALGPLELADDLDAQRQEILYRAFDNSTYMNPIPIPGSNSAESCKRMQDLFARQAIRKGLREKVISQRNWRDREARYKAKKARDAAIADFKPTLHRTGTRLIAERFIPGEEVFECEQCGGGMSERKRVRGKHILECGYCGYSRELAAPKAAIVVRHDVVKALQIKADLLEPVEGATSWKCSECGAEVDCISERMVDRCGYCGNDDFVRSVRPSGVLQPHGMPRFACDAARAEQLLRHWIAQKNDAAIGFAAGLEVVTAQARYVPYWIFDVSYKCAQAANMVMTGVHACASKQLILRMPSELREIEPFETRKAPPFDPGHLAGVVSERFSVGLEQAWSHIQANARRELARHIKASGSSEPVENVLAGAQASFTYLLIPVYFLLLRFEGQEFHALVDGAGAGIGFNYPRSVVKRGARLAITLAVLLVVALIVTAGGVYEFERASVRAEIEAAENAKIEAENAAIDARILKAKKEREAAERKRARYQMYLREWESKTEEERTWCSDSFNVTCPVKSVTYVQAEGEADLELYVALPQLTYFETAEEILRKLRDPQTHRDLSLYLAKFLADKFTITTDGYLDYARGIMDRAMLGALENVKWPHAAHEDAFKYVRLVRKGPEPKMRFTGKLTVECDSFYRSRGDMRSVHVILKMDPNGSISLFCYNTSWHGIAARLYNTLNKDKSLRNDHDNHALAVEIAQKALDEFLDQDVDYDWRGQVKVEAVEIKY